MKRLLTVVAGNLIEIKNNFLMIDFLEKFTKQTKRKVKYTMIGKGILKKLALINQLNQNNEIALLNIMNMLRI